MKKAYFVLFVMLATSCFCAVRLPLAIADEIKTFLGTIESIRPCMSRPPKWYCATFVAVADNKESKEFWILGLSGSRPTSVTDFEGKPMDKPGYNHRPQVGKKVEVMYTISENGHNDAISIRYVPVDYAQKAIAAEEMVNTATQTTVRDKNTLIGRVENISGVAPGFTNNWTYSKIAILTDNGNEFTFFVNKDTALTNENGVTNPPLPKNGQWIEVKYSTKENGTSEAVSICYFDSKPASQPTAASTLRPENIFTGTVKKVDWVLAKAPNWTYERIYVIADSGDNADFFVMRNTVITDPSGNSLSGKSIKKAKKVEIKYSVLSDSSPIINGQKGADSIRYLP